jgi:hypothetical protein
MKYKCKNLFPAFLLTLLLGACAPVLACFCINLPLSESYKKSDAIFTGKIVGIEKFTKNLKLSKIRTTTIEVTEYKFEIAKTFLGLEKSKTVSIFVDGTNCDFNFKKDETYLVWAYQDKQNDLVTNSCTPTKLLEKAGAELDFLQTAEDKTAKAREETLNKNLLFRVSSYPFAVFYS